MAAQGPTTTAATPAVMTSRLTQMQMRFQQRQQQERDQRKVEMVSSTKTATVTNATSGTSSGGSSSTIRSSATAIHHHQSVTSSSHQQDLSASLGAGKVRQMFDERRHHKAAGIDKSYPLQPIGQVVKNGGSGASSNGNTVSPSSKMAANGMNNKTRVPPISANTKARLARQQQENGNGEHALNKSGGGGGSATFDDNENLLEDEKFPDTISFDEDLTLTSTGTPLGRKLPNVGKLTSTTPSSTNGTTPPQNVNSLKLKPVPGRTPTTTSLKASTTPAVPKKSVVPSTNPSSSPRGTGSQPSSAKSRASTAKSGTTATVPGSRKASAASIASGSIASGLTNDSGPVPDGMARCSVCGRNFAEDRVAKHMEICRKTKSKKRKVFDVTKHRVQGTDAEKYVLRKGKAAGSSSKKSVSGPTAAAATTTGTSGGKGDWRRKHEEFIAAIRAAKEMKAYLAKGGKLSDLPPPPPSENPDYIQCPHCSRRFNQTAAERHIPKCATMLHNKPKPAAKGRRV